MPPGLVGPGLLAALTLALDAGQYVLTTAIWFICARYKEVTGTAYDEEFTVPPYLNWPGYLLFYSKFAALIAAYGFIIHHFLKIP